MIEVVNLKEMPQGIMKLDWSIEILPGKHMPARVFPQPLDNVEVRGIWGQKYEIDVEFQSLLPYGLTMLTAGIVKNDGDRGVTCGEPDLLKESYCKRVC